MMDSLEQLHVEGHRQTFLKWPGCDRMASDTDSNAQILRAGSIFLARLACVSF